MIQVIINGLVYPMVSGPAAIQRVIQSFAQYQRPRSMDLGT